MQDSMRSTWLKEPRYTPVHLAAILILALIAVVASPYCVSRGLTRRLTAAHISRIRQGIHTGGLPRVVVEPRQLPPVEPVYAKPYHFIHDAFSWNVPMWTKVMVPYVGKPDLRYLEIGLASGRSFFWMLENVATDPSSHLTGVDLFDGELRDAFFANLSLCGAEDRTTIINEASQLALRTLPLESFDIIYIDGSHVKCDVLEDAVLSWRLLKPGGLMIFDDYEHVKPKESVVERYEAPKVAIDAFYTCFDHRCEVLHNEWQVVLRKKQ